MTSKFLRQYFSLLLLIAGFSVHAQSSKYLGQKPPGLKPEIFAPGVISKKDEFEFGSVFSKDGNAFYYAVELNTGAVIRSSELKRGSWTPTKDLLSSKRFGMNDPFLTMDESELYFISTRNEDGSGKKSDYDIWYVKKRGKGWSDAINAGPNINTRGNEYYISFTQDDAMYFSTDIHGSNHDIYKSKRVDGEYQKPERLSDAINSDNYEADVYVAPDESYIIFARNSGDGRRGDLHVSFKNEDGSWTKAKNMGDQINTTSNDFCPFVTRDGKYLFYSSRGDIYWVDARILDQYK